ncbi:YppF family protein [Mesobacillus foraminis]|uniref:YppF family protein n=1 Tax=Mesobacillus foraminis TaxID=279826 RepID=UPI000EF4CFBD|nr:YppF family protein [Mesobacillus foraminis]
MLFEELIHRFQLEKNQPPSHANELLDFIQKSYIQRELSIVEYKKLYSELNNRNAEKPQSYMFNLNHANLQKVNIPG